MRFRALCECAMCGQEVGGINCLPVTSYVCPHCGARLSLCPNCQSFGLDCPVCADTLVPEWELRENGGSNTRQKSILEYVPSEDHYGGA